jgi:hypothetical protein
MEVIDSQMINSDEYPSFQEACSHLNQHYSLWIRIICLHHHKVRNSLLNRIDIQNARIASISQLACKLSYISCTGVVCSMENITLEFTPYLESAAEAR